MLVGVKTEKIRAVVKVVLVAVSELEQPPESFGNPDVSQKSCHLLIFITASDLASGRRGILVFRVNHRDGTSGGRACTCCKCRVNSMSGEENTSMARGQVSA